MPTPNKEYSVSFPSLNGGINRYDPDYALRANESSEMKNLLWRSGMLRSRKGQYFLNDTPLGQGFAAYERLWHGFVFAHIGESLYCFDAESGETEELSSGIPQVRGTFFLYGDALYYKTRGAYKVITAEENDGEWSFSCSTVVPYEPVIVINASPYTGAGDLYQPENRMSARKTVWYNAAEGVKTYHLPVLADRVIRVEVNGIVLTTGWTYSPYAGTVTFRDAPPVTDPPTNNTVRITCELVNQEAQQSLFDCRYAAVYGGTGELCVVMAGSVSQPNAYYWSGNSNLKMDASYFPLEQVQLAGSTEERITGFGKQQDNLIIFKEGSVGKTTLGTQTINDRIYIDLPYVPINASIGCSLPWSIQLVENNLVFANRSGVYMLLDTTAANENNIVSLSRKLGELYREVALPSWGGSRRAGSVRRSGLCWTAQAVGEVYPAAADEDLVCSCDDGTRYYLTGNGKTFCWDYELSSYKDPSWFVLTNTNAVALIREAGEIYHIDGQGRLTGLHNEYNDYGQPIERVFRFPTMNFSSYDCRKNVNSVLLTLGAYELENTRLLYLTDYEKRQDSTNLQIVNAEMYDAQRTVGTRPQSERTPAVFRRRPMRKRILHFYDDADQ